MLMLDSLFDQIVRNSALGAAAIVLIILVRWIAGRWLAASVRCAMWIPVAVLMIAPQLPDLGLRQPPKPVMVKRVTARVSVSGSIPVIEQTTTPIANVESLRSNSPHQPLPSIITLPMLWAGGALLAMGWWALSFLMLRRRVRRMAEPVSPELKAMLADSAKAMGLRRTPAMLATRAVRAPAIMGWLRPLVLVPPSLSTTLAADELRMVLMHECAHVRRRDLISHWLSMALLSLHWFNPLVWIALRMLRADREAACDAAVLAACESDRRSLYGHTLLKLGSACVPGVRFQALVGMLGSVDMLRNRIVEIARFGKSSTRTGRIAMGLAIAVMLGLAAYAAEAPKLQPVTVLSGGDPATVKQADEQPAELLTRIYKVPPDFLSSASPAQPGLVARPTAKEMLTRNGVEFPEGAAAVFNPATSQLIVKNTVINLERVRKIVAKKSEPPTLILVSSKILVFDEKMLGRTGELADFLMTLSSGKASKAPSFQDMEKDDLAAREKIESGFSVQLTDAQVEQVLRLVMKEKGPADASMETLTQKVLSHALQLITLPTVTTKADTRATVEVIREYFHPTEYGPSVGLGGVLTPTSFNVKNLGASIILDPSLQDDGETIDLKYQATLSGLIETREFKTESGEKLSVPSFHTNSRQGPVSLPYGHTTAFLMSEAPITPLLLSSAVKGIEAVKSKSLPAIIFITANLIDPTGKTVKTRK